MLIKGSTSSDEDTDLLPANGDRNHIDTLARAAQILDECLEVHGDGGVVFFNSTQDSQLERARERNTDDRPAEILASSSSAPFVPIGQNLQRGLLSRYPRGKLWSLTADSVLSSSESEASDERASRTRQATQRADEEAIWLQQHFPNASQVMFMGLWDAGSA